MKRILMIVMLVIAMIGLAQLSLFANQAFAGDGDANGRSSACRCDGVIGDYVWHDLDHGQNHLVDGIQDAGEPGIEGVLVELYDGNGDFYADTTTDANGFYQFTDLPYDDYTVKIADSNFDPGGVLEGWYASPPDEGGDESLDSDGDRDTHEAAVSLNDGNIHNDVDFGFFMTGVDLQKTGPDSVVLGDDITYHFRVENTGDVVLHGGVHVYDALIEPDGDHEIWSGVVYPGEVYEFDRTYTPDEDDCGSLTNTANAVGHPQYPDGSYLDDVTDEDSWTTEVQCGGGYTLGDYVWLDRDSDGVQDAGEPGMAGVTVHLLDGNGNQLASATTDANGHYQFDQLSAGDYMVEFVLPGGYVFSPQDAGGDDALDSDADPNSGRTPVINLGQSDELSWDAGMIYTRSGEDFCYAVSDSEDELVSIRSDGAGFQDIGPLGVSYVEAIAFNLGWTTLYGADADTLGTIDVNTGQFSAIGSFGSGDGADGQVDFDDVDSLSFDPVTGVFYGVTRRNDGAPNDVLFQIDPATGSYVPDAFGAGVDYVIVDSGSVLGLYDIDDIAVDPAGQMYGIANSSGGGDHLVKIDKFTGAVTDVGRLSYNGSGLDDMEGLTAFGADALYGTTGASGNPENSMWRIDKATGAATLITGFPQFGDYEAIACESAPKASIGDYVWHDLDHGQSHLVDGIQDAGEPGLEGVVMELYDDGGALVGTTTTDANGYYQFDNLTPGDYTVKVADSNFQANGALDETDSAVDWHASPQDAGSDDVDSDQDESTYEAAVTLSPGENNLDIDFGFFKSCVKLTKTGPDFVNPGETFNFHFRVENCGDVVLHGGVTVYDALINPDGDHEIWNDVVYPGEVKEFDEAYTADESECPSIVNDATAEGHPQHPDGSYLANVTDEDSWTVTCASFSLGDYVWQDDDADGVQDAGESGINGVTVDLYSGTCDSLTASSTPLQTTTTAANNGVDGWYEFTGLGSGDYCVALSRDNYAPGGPLVGLIASPANASGDPATDSNASASLKADVSLSADDATIDFGLYPAPPIETGQCYVISDSGDYLGRIDHATGKVQVLGKVDPPDGENLAIRPSDFTIFNVAGENTATPLITIDDRTAATTTINADLGLDDVDALAFDTATQTLYAVKVDPNPGVLYTIDPATGATTHVVDLQTPSPDPLAGKTDPHIDGIAIDPNTGVMYGAYSAWASKSYLVTIDTNTGELTFVGGPAGDEGYTGVDDIEDLSFNQDGTLYGVLGDQGAFGGDVSGSFEGLVILDTQTANATAVGQYGDPLQGMGEWDMEALSCAIPPTSASIGDYVWEDANANGVQDAGESGLDGVTVELFKADGTSMGTTTTANGGQYSFDNLIPGDYYVQFTLPNGYVFSPKDQGGDDAKDSDADATTGKTAVTTLSPGENDPTWDAGMYRKASLGDYVWWDQDNDGVQDAGEPGIQDVTVTLKDAGGNTVATTTTDADGAYSFTDLTPGDYTVVFTLPGSDWSFSPQDQGGDDAKDSDADPNTGEVSVNLASGENDLTIDAGMTIPSGYTITKENTTAASDVAPGDPISFTITIENTGDTWLIQIPLRDEYDTDYLTYVDANPASDDNNDDGVIDWSDLTVSFGQDLAPGESFTVVVNFTAKETTENLPNHETINTATAHDVLADPDGTNGPTAAAALPDQSDDAPANILNPVGEAMQGFWGLAAGNAVRLRWQTASELDVLGFNVLRRIDGGRFEQVNEFPIFARHAGADMIGSYSFQDRGVSGENVTYILEIIHLDGSVERYGQVMIAIDEAN